MSTRGRTAGSAAMLNGVEVVVPAAAAAAAGPAAAAGFAAGAAGLDIPGAAVSMAAHCPGFLAHSLWRIPVGGVLSSRSFARDPSSPAPGRSLRAMWATLAPPLAPETTRLMGEHVDGRSAARRVARLGKGTHEVLEWLDAE